MTNSIPERVKARLEDAPKRWLITGVAGFIGSNLLEALLQLGQKVVGVDNFSTGTRKNLEEVREIVGSELWKNFTMLEGDLSDVNLCLKASEGVDIILHQGALGSVPRSIDNPLDSHASNVTGTLNIFWSAYKNKIQRVVYASSSSVYGDDPALPKIESRIGQPLSPYAATKLMNEIYAGVFTRVYGLQTIGLRYFNVFGPRQAPEGPYAAVIPKWISSMLAGEEVYIFGDGETSRDFCYISNVVQANILAAVTENPEAMNKVYNIAVGQQTTLNQLFFLLRDKLIKKMPSLKIADPIYKNFRPGDVRHSLADITLAKSLLEYQPTHTISDGLDEALDWYIQKLRLV